MNEDTKKLQQIQQHVDELKLRASEILKEIMDNQLTRKKMIETQESIWKQHESLLTTLKTNLDEVFRLFKCFEELMRNDKDEFMDVFRKKYESLSTQRTKIQMLLESMEKKQTSEQEIPVLPDYPLRFDNILMTTELHEKIAQLGSQFMDELNEVFKMIKKVDAEEKIYSIISTSHDLHSQIKVANSRIKLMEQERDDALQRLRNAEDNITRLQNHYTKSLEQEHEQKRKLEELLKNAEESIISLTKSTNDIVAKQNEIQTEQIKRINELEVQIDKLQLEKDEKISKLEKELIHAKQESEKISLLQKEISELKAENKKLKEESEAKDKLLAEKSEEIKILLEQLNNIPQQSQPSSQQQPSERSDKKLPPPVPLRKDSAKKAVSNQPPNVKNIIQHLSQSNIPITQPSSSRFSVRNMIDGSTRKEDDKQEHGEEKQSDSSVNVEINNDAEISNLQMILKERKKELQETKKQLESVLKEKKRLVLQNDILTKKISVQEQELSSVLSEILNLHSKLEAQIATKQEMGEISLKRINKLQKVQEMQLKLHVDTNQRLKEANQELLNHLNATRERLFIAENKLVEMQNEAIRDEQAIYKQYGLVDTCKKEEAKLRVERLQATYMITKLKLEVEKLEKEIHLQQLLQGNKQNLSESQLTKKRRTAIISQEPQTQKTQEQAQPSSPKIVVEPSEPSDKKIQSEIPVRPEPKRAKSMTFGQMSQQPQLAKHSSDDISKRQTMFNPNPTFSSELMSVLSKMNQKYQRK